MQEREPVLLDMHLPDFRAGYQDGRRLHFQGASPTNDIAFLDSLYELVRDGLFAEKQHPDAAYIIGQLMGSISCNVITRQEGEPDPKECEQRFLTALRQDCANNPNQESIVALVQSCWKAQDELARLLSESRYEQMLRRGTVLPALLQ